MKTIRSNVFETNSSSTHSIAIPKNCETNNFISFHVGDFGWGWEEVDPADYFYTAIYETSNTEEELNRSWISYLVFWSLVVFLISFSM